MAPQNLHLGSLLSNAAPKNLRILAARGLVPLPLKEMLESLVSLALDSDQEVASLAKQTIASYEEEEILLQLRSRNCAPAVLEYFAAPGASESMLRAVITNPSCPEKLLESLALTVPPRLLETILDNRVRILKSPGILRCIKSNPSSTPEIQRLVQEIEIEFLGDKKKEYAIEEPGPSGSAPYDNHLTEFEFDIPEDDLYLEGLPVEAESREAAIGKRLSALSVPERIRYALFGNREIRMQLIRDPNREVARMVLRSPKLTEGEIEMIAGMRSVSEDILREIGNNKEFTASYNVVHNLVKNPKAPPSISQRLLFRLRSQDLALLARDRGIPEAVRYSATRTLSQRSPNKPAK